MSINYVPPSQKLFNSRHRISRRDLQQFSNLNTDWTTVLDVPIDFDSQLISYAVPVIGDVSQQPTKTHSSVSKRSTANCSKYSISSDYTDTSSVFEPDLKIRMLGNVSLESLVQENKEKISSRQESIDLFESTGQHDEAQRLKRATKKEDLKLRCENRQLLVREDFLAKKWEAIRKDDDYERLLFAMRASGIFWFGVPGDIRRPIYAKCLYDCDVTHIQNRELYENISKCLKGDDRLSRQIYSNLSRSLEWFNTNSPCKFSKVLETRLQQKFSGLYYHLKETVKKSIFSEFLKPLIVNGITNAIRDHHQDELGLEILDVLIFSMYTRELETVILDDFLSNMLMQTYHKFFSNDSEVFDKQLLNIKVEPVQVLEAIRQKHGKSIINSLRHVT
ncbi:hypothetical protein HG535_0H02160 [Zygotorulaspora mrakii]|uniref:Uncharacterized protein n=1 Tax=Zygotorulaspora mrakii TaxID=42260 RepID=A0A7H9BA48_ZYGMR|nr:uncharacterized protein HG535_0H02160 [Zygotorulaspora mrakii]QLG74889.1 hypothetical protein HG535_0H02160 [Zygotorulaspora mrakii]